MMSGVRMRWLTCLTREQSNVKSIRISPCVRHPSRRWFPRSGSASVLRGVSGRHPSQRRPRPPRSKEAGAEFAQWERERAHDLRTLQTASILVEGLGGAARGRERRASARRSLRCTCARSRKSRPPDRSRLRDTSGRPVASSAPALSPRRAAVDVARDGAVDGCRRGATPAGMDALAAPLMLDRGARVVASQRARRPHRRRRRLARCRSRACARRVCLAAEVVVLVSDGTPLADAHARLGPCRCSSARRCSGFATRSVPKSAYRDSRNREMLGEWPLRRRCPRWWWRSASAPALRGVARSRSHLCHPGQRADAHRGRCRARLGRSDRRAAARLTSAADRVAAGDLGVTLQNASEGPQRHSHARVLVDDRAVRRSQGGGRAPPNEALRAQNDELEKLATTDFFTGLYNRKNPQRPPPGLSKVWMREGMPFALLVVEIDNPRPYLCGIRHAGG